MMVEIVGYIKNEMKEESCNKKGMKFKLCIQYSILIQIKDEHLYCTFKDLQN